MATIKAECGYCGDEQSLEVDDVPWNKFQLREELVQGTTVAHVGTRCSQR